MNHNYFDVHEALSYSLLTSFIYQMLLISSCLDILWFFFAQNEESSEVLNGVIAQIVYRKALEAFPGKNLEDQ